MGLSVSEGFIATGSETNEVSCSLLYVVLLVLRLVVFLGISDTVTLLTSFETHTEIFHRQAGFCLPQGFAYACLVV